jgi:Raf kinase inhibitor-like YbhB/YbcL family protein
MHLSSSSFSDGQAIPGNFAFCVPDPESHATFAPNLSPALTWDGVPEETRSFVLICHDRDVPTKPDDVNQEGREVPSDLPRADFFHWVLVDIPSHVREFVEGEFSDGVTERGKPQSGPYGARPGVNDYTGWFSGDPNMEGTYYGYDGPCPPWNDSLVHHYVFTLYATDFDRYPVDGDFGGADVRSALEGHVLAEASIMGTYTLNPRLM